LLLLLLLEANRTEIPRRVVVVAAGDGTRRHIRPDCGSRNRGMDAVTEAMALASGDDGLLT
jgi:hypothetical protein